MIIRLSLAALLAAGVGYFAARVARAPRCPWCDRRHWLRCAAQVDAERADSTCHEPATTCRCEPCPGRGTDGHGMSHCAECCYGTHVTAEPGCPVHWPLGHGAS